MKIEISTHFNSELIKAWESLWKKSPYANYTNGPQWFLSLLQTFEYKNYVIITLFDNGALVGIAALVKEKRYGVPVYTVALSDFVCGMPFLINLSNKKHIKTFFNALEDLGNIYFDNIPEDLKTILQSTIPTTDITETTVNYFLHIKHDSNGVVSLDGRKKMLHKIKHMQDSFILKSYDGTHSKGLENVFAIDNISRKQGRGYNTFADETMMKFYKSLAKNFREDFKTNILYFDKTPIAYEIGFLIGSTYYGNQIAFIGDYSEYSPGKVILLRLIDYLGSLKSGKFDFGSGDSHLKRMITEDHQKLYQVVISRNYFTRRYVTTLKKLNSNLYVQLQKHVKIYSFYKKVTKLIKR